MYTQAYMRIDVHANEDICAHKLWYLVPWHSFMSTLIFGLLLFFLCRCCTRQHRSFWGCVQLVRTRANGREHRSRKRSPNSVLDSNARSNDSHRWIRRLHVIFFVLDAGWNMQYFLSLFCFQFSRIFNTVPILYCVDAALCAVLPGSAESWFMHRSFDARRHPSHSNPLCG